MRTATLIPVAAACFAIGYLQALGDGSKYGHPGWFLLMLAVVIATIVVHQIEEER